MNRIAKGVAVGVALSAIAAACSASPDLALTPTPPADTTTPPGNQPAAVVATVTVQLDSASLTTGSTSGAHATIKDSSGAVMSGQPVSWLSSNTSVATVSGGVVAAVGPGKATISATAGQKTGSASVTVSSPPAPPPSQPSVATVAVTLDSASLGVGHTGAAHFVAKDSAGNVLTGKSATWATNKSSVATVSSSGVVTGMAAGTASISASVNGITGSATVTVVALPAPPPSGSLANECNTPGAGWIFCDDFDSDRTAKYFEYDNAGGRFVRTAAKGVDGSTGMRATYATGQAGAGHLSLAFGQTPGSYFKPVDAGTAKYREIYWRFYLKREAPWTNATDGHGPGPDKLTRATIFAGTDWSQAMIAHGWTSDANRNYLLLDPASGTNASGTVVTTQYNDFDHLSWLGSVTSANQEEARIGEWACYEFHLKLNSTSGAADGVFELTVDGQLSARKTGLNFVSTYTAYGINAILLENYQNDGAPGPNVRTFDNFVVSTSPIGCGTT